jgi:hypothetical protein
VRFTVRVEGLREFQRAAKKAEGDLDKQLRAELKEIGDIVVQAADARGSRYTGIGPYKPVVQQRAVLVRQSKNKVTGRRGDFGGLQMRNVLIPALGEKEGEITEAFEEMLDRLVASSGL